MKQIASGTNFTTGNITKHLLTFMLPFLAANILNSIYNTVDMVVIGKYVGSIGTVAVAQGGKIMQMLTHVVTAISSAGQVLIAQEVGAGQKHEVQSSVKTLMTGILIFSAVVAVVLAFLTLPVIQLLRVPGESFDAAAHYMWITLLGFPAVAVYTAVCSILRSMGDSKNPLLFIAVSATTNLILDVLFVAYFGAGVYGAAAATVISQYVACMLSCIRLYVQRSHYGLTIDKRFLSIDRRKLKIIVDVGAPMSLHSLCINGTQLVLVGMVNGFGLISATAYSIGDKILTLTNVVQTSVNQASATIIAQNIGAGQYNRVRMLIRRCMCITLSVATVLSVLSLWIPETIFGLFTKDSDVLAYANTFMQIAVSTYYLSVFCGTFGGIVTGSGNGRLQMIVGILDGVVLRIGFSLLFGYVLHMGAPGFFLGSSLARLSPVCINSLYYYSGAWMRRKRLVDISQNNEK